MVRTFALLVMLGLLTSGQVSDSSAQSVNEVVQWNRTLLVIVRTPGAQPATIHPTRSFAIMHAAIYDAVNAIERTHTPYVVDLSGVSRRASQEAAAAAAAHGVLVGLYPKSQAMLDIQLEESLGIRRASALREKSWGAAFLRQRDPDAAGRARPRAPSAAPAAAPSR